MRDFSKPLILSSTHSKFVSQLDDRRARSGRTDQLFEACSLCRRWPAVLKTTVTTAINRIKYGVAAHCSPGRYADNSAYTVP